MFWCSTLTNDSGRYFDARSVQCLSVSCLVFCRTHIIVVCLPTFQLIDCCDEAYAMASDVELASKERDNPCHISWTTNCALMTWRKCFFPWKVVYWSRCLSLNSKPLLRKGHQRDLGIAPGALSVGRKTKWTLSRIFLKSTVEKCHMPFFRKIITYIYLCF